MSRLVRLQKVPKVLSFWNGARGGGDRKVPKSFTMFADSLPPQGRPTRQNHNTGTSSRH